MDRDVFKVSESSLRLSKCNRQKYEDLYQRSVTNPEDFWSEQADRLVWMKRWKTTKSTSFKKPVSIEWFQGGVLNVTVNCIDRHLEKHSDRVAYYWESDNPNDPIWTVTYGQLYEEVCRCANALKSVGVKKGDRVTIYLPMIPEAVFSMLACARIGAVHSVVFGGFSSEALAGRIQDCDSRFVITADEAVRGGKTISLKSNVDEALKSCPRVKSVLVVRRTGAPISWNPKIDRWYEEVITQQESVCQPEPMGAEDPLFILYTSGSTGKPKGVLHTTAGYLLYASLTHDFVFDVREKDVYWCTADVGWVTGHSYVVYGPLCNGTTSVLFEGTPSYPSSSRHWEIVDKFGVSIYYTAPTALRALMREGNEPVKRSSRKTLRLLGSVGEPINPEAWRWYYSVVGERRCPIVDTWWQTETGGILISPLPGAMDLKPGSATRPFFGVQPVIVDQNGSVLEGESQGQLCIKDSWPGQARTVYGDHARFEETYFSKFPGLYFTGDGCHRDRDGDYWISGRIDDVLNVSGHRLGTAELESAFVENERVAEAAVVGFPHQIKGQGIYAFVTLKAGNDPSEGMRAELREWVRKKIGPIASPDYIQWAPALPKTRSGKIMRRILRKIASNQFDELGDTSTLADPTVVDDLIETRLNR